MTPEWLDNPDYVDSETNQEEDPYIDEERIAFLKHLEERWG